MTHVEAQSLFVMLSSLAKSDGRRQLLAMIVLSDPTINNRILVVIHCGK